MNSGIYGLFDPRDGSIQYVGQTINFERRLVELNVVCHDSLTYNWSFNNSND